MNIDLVAIFGVGGALALGAITWLVSRYIDSRVDVGTQQAQRQEAEETNKRMNADVKTYKDVQHQIDVVSADAVRNKLRERWSRD